MQIPIVDKNDNILYYKDRSEVDYKNELFRTSSLWISNNKGEILLAQRKFDKKIDPGKWGEAVGGTVEKSDSYFDTIIREAQEELGLTNISITPDVKQFFQTKTYSCFVQWYKAVIDKDISEFVIQQEEIERVVWMAVDKFKQDLTINPDKYVSCLQKCVELLQI